jgi:hypothetical protein
MCVWYITIRRRENKMKGEITHLRVVQRSVFLEEGQDDGTVHLFPVLYKLFIRDSFLFLEETKSSEGSGGLGHGDTGGADDEDGEAG